MANGRLGPIDECAAIVGYENISGIKIQMIECVWNTSCGEKAKTLFDLLLKAKKLRGSQDGRRRFVLLVHEFGHDREELICAIEEGWHTDIATARSHEPRRFVK